MTFTRLFIAWLNVVAALFIGAEILKHYRIPPAPVVVTRIGVPDISPPDPSPSIFNFKGASTSYQICGIYVYTTDALYAEHKIPPRCRNVPEGSGCIDWLELGEKDWETVLAHRPKGTAK